jgi:hypothetical protein
MAMRSRNDWVIRPHGELADEIDWLAPSLLPGLTAPEDEGAAGAAGDCAGWGPSQ